MNIMKYNLSLLGIHILIIYYHFSNNTNKVKSIGSSAIEPSKAVQVSISMGCLILLKVALFLIV